MSVKNRIARWGVLPLSVVGLLLAACTAPPVANVPTATPPPTAEAQPAAEAPATAAADTTITLTDALGREITLPAPPQRIVLTGRGLFMIADAIYTFPEPAGASPAWARPRKAAATSSS